MSGESSDAKVQVLVACDTREPRPAGYSRRDWYKRKLLAALMEYMLENFDNLPLEMQEVFCDGAPGDDYFTLRLVLLGDPAPRRGPRVVAFEIDSGR